MMHSYAVEWTPFTVFAIFTSEFASLMLSLMPCAGKWVGGDYVEGKMGNRQRTNGSSRCMRQTVLFVNSCMYGVMLRESMRFWRQEWCMRA